MLTRCDGKRPRGNSVRLRKAPACANTERGGWIYAPAVLEHTRGLGVAHALTLRQGNGARWKQVPAAAKPACCCPCALSGSMGLSHWVFSIKKRGTFVPLCAGSSSYSRRALRFCYELLLYAETACGARVAPLHCSIPRKRKSHYKILDAIR